MKLAFVDKIGSLGVLATAAACPVCWPLFASAGSALGLGVLAPYEPFLMNAVFPAFVLVALIGGIVAFMNHRRYPPLIVNLASVAMILYGFYGGWHLVLMYIGIFGVVISSVLAHFSNRRCRIASP